MLLLPPMELSQQRSVHLSLFGHSLLPQSSPHISVTICPPCALQYSLHMSRPPQCNMHQCLNHFIENQLPSHPNHIPYKKSHCFLPPILSDHLFLSSSSSLPHTGYITECFAMFHIHVSDLYWPMCDDVYMKTVQGVSEKNFIRKGLRVKMLSFLQNPPWLC